MLHHPKTGLYQVRTPFASAELRQQQVAWCQHNLSGQSPDTPAWIAPWRPLPREIHRWLDIHAQDTWSFRSQSSAMAFELAWGFVND